MSSPPRQDACLLRLDHLLKTSQVPPLPVVAPPLLPVWVGVVMVCIGPPASTSHTFHMP